MSTHAVGVTTAGVEPEAIIPTEDVTPTLATAGRAKRKEQGSFGYNRRRQAKRRAKTPRQRILSFCWEGENADLPLELARVVAEYAVCGPCQMAGTRRMYIPRRAWWQRCVDYAYHRSTRQACMADCLFDGMFSSVVMCEACDSRVSAAAMSIQSLYRGIQYDEKKEEMYIDLDADLDEVPPWHYFPGMEGLKEWHHHRTYWCKCNPGKARKKIDS